MRQLLKGLYAALILCAAAAQARAEWHEARSNHFIIMADLDAAELKSFGERLERFDQAVRKLRAMDDPPLSDAQRLTIFALKDEDAVSRLFGADGVFGFYSSSAAGSYAFVPRKPGFYAQRAQVSPESVFFHEYAHHLQLSGSSAALPAWVTEGFAEFFATAEVMADGSVRVGAPPMHREWSVQKYSGLTMIDMLSGSLRNSSYRVEAAIYGRGWLLTHMLTFDPARRGQLQRYIDAIQNGTDALQAAKSAFADDLRSVDRDLDKYLRQSKFSTLVVEGRAIPIGPITIRAMRPAEAAIMDVRMKLRRGVGKKDRARVVAEARKVAATNPDEPQVQVALAEAEYESRNYTAAETAGRRAVTADAKLGTAPILVGKAKMELGRQSGAGTDWKEIRSWFLQANKIDHENAEPLMLFYRTFLYANTAPTPNAIKGLLYAVTLAPHDEDLRIEAVRQLVVDNRLDEARQLFAPTAYYLHSTIKWRATKTAIMDALTQSDRSTALNLIDAEQKERSAEKD